MIEIILSELRLPHSAWEGAKTARNEITRQPEGEAMANRRAIGKRTWNWFHVWLLVLAVVIGAGVTAMAFAADCGTWTVIPSPNPAGAGRVALNSVDVLAP